MAPDLNEMRRKFIRHELMALTIQGAFQRANVYATNASDESERVKLRESLASKLRDLESQYFNPVSEQQHKVNIEKIAAELTGEFKGRHLLCDDRFRIGIAQKALNLYLKYLWCLGEVARPPHCPFDGGIIAKLKLSEPEKKRLEWTKLASLDDYQMLVNAGLERAKAEDLSLPEWELEHWGSEWRGRAL